MCKSQTNPNHRVPPEAWTPSLSKSPKGPANKGYAGSITCTRSLTKQTASKPSTAKGSEVQRQRVGQKSGNKSPSAGPGWCSESGTVWRVSGKNVQEALKALRGHQLRNPRGWPLACDYRSANQTDIPPVGCFPNPFTPCGRCGDEGWVVCSSGPSSSRAR